MHAFTGLLRLVVGNEKFYLTSRWRAVEPQQVIIGFQNRCGFRVDCLFSRHLPRTCLLRKPLEGFSLWCRSCGIHPKLEAKGQGKNNDDSENPLVHAAMSFLGDARL
jgi:hypothetical protein